MVHRRGKQEYTTLFRISLVGLIHVLVLVFAIAFACAEPYCTVDELIVIMREQI